MVGAWERNWCRTVFRLVVKLLGGMTPCFLSAALFLDALLGFFEAGCFVVYCSGVGGLGDFGRRRIGIASPFRCLCVLRLLK